MDIGHKNWEEAITWWWDDRDNKVRTKKGGHVPNKYYTYKGRFNPKTREISVMTPSGEVGIPSWLQDALELEFGTGLKTYEF